MMIEINLLPGARRAKASSRQPLELKSLVSGASNRFRDRYLVISTVVTVVALLVAAGLFLEQTRSESTLAERREKAVADSTGYANFLKDRARAEAVRDTLLRQVNVIRGLDEDRFVWPHVLDEVSRALPQYTWLTSLAITGTPQGNNNVVAAPKSDSAGDAKRPKAKRLDTEIPKDTVKISLKGRTVDIQALTRFMTDLEASPFLANITIDKVSPTVDQGKEVREFSLTFAFTRPDTLLLRRVPLTLSTLAGLGGK
jgi:Tfp pilus assembly protein PilN